MIVASKQELIKMRNHMVGCVRTDVRNQIISFMEQHQTSPAELADVLGIPQNRIDALIGGNTDMTLSEFITFLIATDNVIKIVPVEEAQREMQQNGIGAFRGSMPPTANKGAKRGPNGRFVKRTPDEPMGVPPMPMGVPPMPMGSAPIGIPPMGRTANPTTTAKTLTSEFDGMKRSDLIAYIKQNIPNWNDFINLEDADRAELIEFVESIKEQQMANAATEAPTSDAETESLIRGLGEMVSQNPSLKAALKALLG